MRATVICESSFGNTRAIAEAIAETLDAEVLSAGRPDRAGGGRPAGRRSADPRARDSGRAQPQGSGRPGRQRWARRARLAGRSPARAEPRRGVRHALRQAGIPDRVGREGHCQTAAATRLRAGRRAGELLRARHRGPAEGRRARARGRVGRSATQSGSGC